MERIQPPPAERILNFMASCELFQMVDAQYLMILASKLSWYDVQDGEVFIVEGRPAGSIYLVFEGQLEVYKCGDDGREIVVGLRSPGESVGELALLSGDRREASVRAKGPATVARFSRSGLVRVCANDPAILDSVTEIVRRRLAQDRLIQLLSTGDLFSELSESIRRDLIQEMNWVVLKAGEEFIRQGDQGDFLGVIVSGRMLILHEDPDGQVRLLNEAGKGATVGEMALLSGDPRRATVRAARDAELVRLSQADYVRLVRKHPLEMTRAFAGGMVERLWQATEGQKRPVNNVATIAIVPASTDIPVRAFSHQLSQALIAIGATRYLNSRLVDDYLDLEDIAQTPPEGLNNGRLVTWLNTQEHRFDYVVYETDPRPTEWSKRCIRQADLVLIVGQGHGSPERQELERALLDVAARPGRARRVLVLCHKDNTVQPQGTAAWLQERPGVDRHFHVRVNQPADYTRLARALTGLAVGVVLSGGGARGAAHIGVLLALEKAGLAIDHIGGNSAGSVVAAAYAVGLAPADIPDLVKQAYKPGNFFDPTIPLFSLFSGRRGARFHRRILGDVDIEDLWLPYFCVSSNLTRAEIMVHDHGPLWRAVLASNSAPGMRPPVVHQGDLLMDGALLDDLPLDVMREKIDSGMVIAVDVSPPVDLAENPDYGEHISGWRILWNRLNPLARPLNLPSIAVILQRAAELSSKRAQRRLVNARLADLYICPPVEQFSMMDSRAIDEMVTIACEAAGQQIDYWLAEEKRRSLDPGNGRMAGRQAP